MKEQTLGMIIVIIVALLLVSIVVFFLGGANLDKWFDAFKNIVSIIMNIFITWTIHVIPVVR